MERKFGISVDLIEEITKLTKERILSNIVFILSGIIIYFYLSTTNNLVEIEHLSKIAQDNLRYMLYVMLGILAPTIIIFMYINKNHPKIHAKFKSNFICLLRDINILINQFKIFTIIGLTVLTIVMRDSTALLFSNLLSIILAVFIFIILNALINLIIQDILSSNQLQKVDDMKYKCIFINHLKQNWIAPVISGLVGCIITLFAIFALHVKTWDSNAWSAAFNFFVATGTIMLAIFAWIAYKDYWRQRHINQTIKPLTKFLYFIKTDLLVQIDRLIRQIEHYDTVPSNSTLEEQTKFKLNKLEEIVTSFKILYNYNSKITSKIKKIDLLLDILGDNNFLLWNKVKVLGSEIIIKTVSKEVFLNQYKNNDEILNHMMNKSRGDLMELKEFVKNSSERIIAIVKNITSYK